MPRKKQKTKKKRAAGKATKTAASRSKTSASSRPKKSPGRQKSPQRAKRGGKATSGRKGGRAAPVAPHGAHKTAKRAKSQTAKTSRTAPSATAPQPDGTTAVDIRLPDNLEEWPVGDLTPYEGNPRTHSDAQVTKIAASLIEFGWTNPILVDDDGNIIAGHGRLLAALSLGMVSVPVIRLSHMTDEQRRAYLIADNQLALDAGWDDDLLAAELKALGAVHFDLSVIGFDPHELHGYIGDAPTEEVPTPEPPDDPVTQGGDLWIMGDHRLICGDCSDEMTMLRLLDGAVIDLVNTDPPYNVKLEPRSNNALVASRGTKSGGTHHQKFDRARRKTQAKSTGKMRAKDVPLEGDFASAEDFAAMLRGSIQIMTDALRPGRHFYFWGGYGNLWGQHDAPNVPPMLEEAGLFVCQMIVWHKLHPVLVRKPFLQDYEICLFGWKTGAAHIKLNVVDVTDVWPVKKINPAAMIHLTEKPVELAARAVQYSSAPGDRVLDSFAGSGSTLMACEQHGRSCYTSELAPAYCDVIVQRWQDETGQSAILESSGDGFEGVAALRLID